MTYICRFTPILASALAKSSTAERSLLCKSSSAAGLNIGSTLETYSKFVKFVLIKNITLKLDSTCNLQIEKMKNKTHMSETLHNF